MRTRDSDCECKADGANSPDSAMCVTPREGASALIRVTGSLRFSRSVGDHRERSTEPFRVLQVPASNGRRASLARSPNPSSASPVLIRISKTGADRPVVENRATIVAPRGKIDSSLAAYGRALKELTTDKRECVVSCLSWVEASNLAVVVIADVEKILRNVWPTQMTAADIEQQYGLMVSELWAAATGQMAAMEAVGFLHPPIESWTAEQVRQAERKHPIYRGPLNLHHRVYSVLYIVKEACPNVQTGASACYMSGDRACFLDVGFWHVLRIVAAWKMRQGAIIAHELWHAIAFGLVGPFAYSVTQEIDRAQLGYFQWLRESAAVAAELCVLNGGRWFSDVELGQAVHPAWPRWDWSVPFYQPTRDAVARGNPAYRLYEVLTNVVGDREQLHSGLQSIMEGLRSAIAPIGANRGDVATAVRVYGGEKLQSLSSVFARAGYSGLQHAFERTWRKRGFYEPDAVVPHGVSQENGSIRLDVRDKFRYRRDPDGDGYLFDSVADLPRPRPGYPFVAVSVRLDAGIRTQIWRVRVISPREEVVLLIRTDDDEVHAIKRAPFEWTSFGRHRYIDVIVGSVSLSDPIGGADPGSITFSWLWD